MKLALNLGDVDFARTKTLGIVKVQLGLVRGFAALEDVSELHVLGNSSVKELLGPDRSAKVVLHGADRAPPRKLQRVLWDQAELVRRANALAVDWLILPKGFPPLFLWPKCRVCSYLHDDIFTFYRQTGLQMSLVDRVYFPALLKRALRRADALVTNSQFTRQTLGALGPRADVVTIGVGFDAAETSQPLAQRRGGIVVLVSPLAHKLTSQALAWLRRWEQETVSRHPVHLVGRLPDGVGALIRSGWQVHGRLSDQEYYRLRASCRVLLYFSAYEGYGSPPREALFEGTPALASDLPPLREDLQPECLFDNADYDGWAAKLERMLSAERCPPISLPGWPEVARRCLRVLRGQPKDW